MCKINTSTLCFIVFLCIVVYSVSESNAAGVSKAKDQAPCDTCPRKGKCVPKISCPAHVRRGASNPECHLKNGQIGICCYTGHKHAVKSDYDLKKRSSKNAEYKKEAHRASKAKWKKWRDQAKNVLEYSDDTVVSSGSPDYGHQLSFLGSNDENYELGDGALLNLFATEDLKEQEAIDGDELALEYDEGYKGPYCPPQPVCPPPSKYRNVSGECLIPEHPTWGAVNTGYERLLPPDYSDGIWALRTSKCGEPLASPRAISIIMLLDEDNTHPKKNIMNMQFSQFLTHDVTQAKVMTLGNGSFISCCAKDGSHLPPEQLHYACAPICVSPEDEFFSHFNKTCLNFVRLQLAPSPDCSCGYAKQMNGVTHLLDLSQLYGSSEDKQNSLRGPEGRLKVFTDYGRDFPPLTDGKECIVAKDQGPCYDSGDNHANQLITLLGDHVIFTREHNEKVKALRILNPGLSDDDYFNQAKRIMIAQYQHIIMNEWLPGIIGPELMEAFDLATCDGYSTYDPEVNPSVLSEFVAAAMRFGHSTVDGRIKVINPSTGKLSQQIWIPDVMFYPSLMRVRYFLDDMLFSMISQPMQKVDPFMTFGLTRYMFRGGNAFGLDLASLNIQRGRDFGLRPYNDYRSLCGLKRIESFDEYKNTTRDRLAAVYACPDDMDLWIGGLLEKPVEGGVVGPTFAHIIAEQFSRFKRGDPRFYTHGKESNPWALTPSQRAEIEKVTLARILCDNLDKIRLTSLSPRAFVRADYPGNAPVQCDDTDAIPAMDLSKFKCI